jgi:hypothetical protein
MRVTYPRTVCRILLVGVVAERGRFKYSCRPTPTVTDGVRSIQEDASFFAYAKFNGAFLPTGWNSSVDWGGKHTELVQPACFWLASTTGAC